MKLLFNYIVTESRLAYMQRQAGNILYCWFMLGQTDRVELHVACYSVWGDIAVLSDEIEELS